MTAPEKDLIVRARMGDESAFGQLLADCLPKLTRLIHKQFNVKPDDLEDIIQVASVKAWSKMSAFRGESAFLTWFCMILKNETLNHFKKRAQIEKHELPARAPTEEKEGDFEHLVVSTLGTHPSLDDKLNETARTIIEKQETLEAYRTVIEEILNKLTPAHSQIMKMVLEEKSYQQIADELGIPIGTVMSRLFFARKNAKKMISQYAERNDLQLPCVGRH